MKKFFLTLLLIFPTFVANADDVSVITINELLIDPTVGSGGFDTDGDGAFESEDEFIELFNSSSSAVDISGWQLYVGSGGTQELRHTFGAGSTVASGGFFTVVAEYSGTPPSGFVQSDDGSNFLGNGGDNIALFDPSSSLFSSYVYNGDPDLGALGLPAGATLFGNVIDLGDDEDGFSIAANRDGSFNYGVAAPTPGASNVPEPNTALVIATLSGLAFIRRRR